MALKGERIVESTDCSLSFTVPTGVTTVEPGTVLVYVTTAGSAGSGVAIGTSKGKAQRSASSSGTVIAGVLLNEFVNIDETVQFRNRHKDQMNSGEVATLLKRGRFATNNLVTGTTPTVGGIAYLSSSGAFTPTLGPGGLVDTPVVGRFAGVKDELGYVTIDVNLP